MRDSRRGLGGVYLRGGVWWVRYSHRGTKRRESAHSTKHSAAVRLLKKRLGEIGQGKLPGRDAERVTIKDLEKILLDDYGLKGNRTTARVEQAFVHIREHFGASALAIDMTPDALTSYAMARQRAPGGEASATVKGAAPATVKNELAALRRAFNLAVRAGRLPQRPAFPVIEARNRRTGFFEDAEFQAVLALLPQACAAVAEFMYWTGWRKGEVLALEWRHIDEAAGIIRIEDTKNRDPRSFPFTVLPALAALIKRQRELTTAAEQARGIIVRHVFHRDGKPVHSIGRAWTTACTAAGLPHRIPHDFRRTAARNLSRAGVPEQVIMSLCGWKTRSVFDRYRIVNETDLADGLAKLARTSGAPRAPRKVLPMRTGTVQAQSAPMAGSRARLSH